MSLCWEKYSCDSLKIFSIKEKFSMAKKQKGFNQPDMPSGINIMGMGGSGEKASQPAPHGPQVDTQKMMKGNAQKGQ